MATGLVVSFNARQAAGAQRTGKQRLYRGATRTQIRKLLARLRALRARDDRELARSVQVGFTPTLITRGPTNRVQTAFDVVIQRLADAMNAKEGDE